jgi:hypothetical protein
VAVIEASEDEIVDIYRNVHQLRARTIEVFNDLFKATVNVQCLAPAKKLYTTRERVVSVEVERVRVSNR